MSERWRTEMTDTEFVVNETAPTYPHDCTDCVWLGGYEYITYSGTPRYCDLYVCPNEPTVLARFGEDGEYYSGMFAHHVCRPLAEAANRAVERGLL